MSARRRSGASSAWALARQTPRGKVDMPDAPQPIVDSLPRVTEAMGIHTPVDVEQTADGPRLNLSGEEAELLVRHRGEPLKGLQHIVDMAFGRRLADDKRVFVDA